MGGGVKRRRGEREGRGEAPVADGKGQEEPLTCVALAKSCRLRESALTRSAAACTALRLSATPAACNSSEAFATD